MYFYYYSISFFLTRDTGKNGGEDPETKAFHHTFELANLEVFTFTFNLYIKYISYESDVNHTLYGCDLNLFLNQRLKP